MATLQWIVGNVVKWRQYRRYLSLCRIYRVLYFGPCRCARPLRINSCLRKFPVSPIYFVKRKNIHFVYHSIPKTGCTTIKLLLLDSIDVSIPANPKSVHGSGPRNRHMAQNSGDYIYRLPGRKRDDYDKASSNLLPILSPFDKAFHFGFVRNPWDRLVSCYLDKVVGLWPDRFHAFCLKYPHVGFNRMSFSDFVKFVCRVPEDFSEPHFRSQSSFWDASALDFIGRFERFSDDLTHLINHLGLDKRLLKWATVKTNQSLGKTGHYSDFYTAETRRLVADKYASDIEQFNYRFGD